MPAAPNIGINTFKPPNRYIWMPINRRNVIERSSIRMQRHFGKERQPLFSRYPRLVGNPGPMVDPASCDEEKIRQAVEVDDYQAVDLV
jgi:hypothetical protein